MYAPHLTSYLSGHPMNCEWYLQCLKVYGNDEILEFEVSETSWTFLLFICQVLGLEDANSTEFDSATPHPCVVFMPEVSLLLSAPVSGSRKKDVECGHYLYQAAKAQVFVLFCNHRVSQFLGFRSFAYWYMAQVL